LEFRHAEVAEFSREGVDGSECCPGSGRKDKSVRDEDLECVFAFFSIEMGNM